MKIGIHTRNLVTMLVPHVDNLIATTTDTMSSSCNNDIISVTTYDYEYCSCTAVDGCMFIDSARMMPLAWNHTVLLQWMPLTIFHIMHLNTMLTCHPSAAPNQCRTSRHCTKRRCIHVRHCSTSTDHMTDKTAIKKAQQMFAVKALPAKSRKAVSDSSIRWNAVASRHPTPWTAKQSAPLAICTCPWFRMVYFIVGRTHGNWFRANFNHATLEPASATRSS